VTSAGMEDNINVDLLHQDKAKTPKDHQGSSSIDEQISEGHIIFHRNNQLKHNFVTFDIENKVKILIISF
jgi:hypothetical protein